MPIKKSHLKLLFWLCTAGSGAALVVLAGLYLYLGPKLPPVDSLRQVQLQTPLRVYSSDGKLIGEFGEQRRTPLSYEELPDLYIKALLSAEDAEFYDHSGVSIRGLLRAASQLLQTGAIQSGGSTLTMQLARDFFLSREQVFSRKFNEILLALQIENELTKQEILELFSNKMFFGNRAYGIQAASQIYYGKDIDELELHQWAMIVGVLKAPSAYNPLANLERATIRRNWILGRMLELGHIDQATYEVAVNTPDNARYHGATLELYAPYIAELARREAIDRFGQDAYNDGYKIYTTVNSRYQAAAQQAVVKGLMTYDWRHGYRGPEAQWGEPPEDLETWVDQLEDITAYGGLEPAVVLAVNEQSAEILRADGTTLELGWDQGLSSARGYINEDARHGRPETASEVVSVGDVIRLYNIEGTWHLRQLPAAQAALVGLDPENGAIRSLVGGFDFRYSNFNRALQAERQPGSSFKPFVYTAALKNGFTPATVVNDSPLVIEDSSLEGAWRPENDGGTFLGPTRLREALYRSRNLVSIRVLRNIGLTALLDTLEQFGFDPQDLPRNLSLALGSHALTPLEMARGYAIFANGGYQVEPYLVQRIENVDGEVIHRARPVTVCRECEQALAQAEEPDSLVADIFSDPTESDLTQTGTPGSVSAELGETARTPGTPVAQPQGPELLKDVDTLIPPPIAPRVLDARTAYIIDSMLRDVIKRGTGRRARVLDRSDIGGKTGTTNGPRDAWFAGYSPHLVTIAWLGFDDYDMLGRGEYGGNAALPIWIDYMREALAGKPDRLRPQPDGIVTVKIDPENGRRARPGDPDAIFEIFRSEEVPPYDSNGNGGSVVDNERLPEELF